MFTRFTKEEKAIHYPADRRMVIAVKPYMRVIFASMILLPVGAAWLQYLVAGLPADPELSFHSTPADPTGFPAWVNLSHWVNFFFLVLIIRRDLGGRRKVQPNSINTGWRVAAFRGYADYMETDAFKAAIKQLEAMASKERTAYMCSEAVWWRCHRSLVSDHFKMTGWTVMHIMGIGKMEEHPYTGPAGIIGGHLIYSKE